MDSNSNYLMGYDLIGQIIVVNDVKVSIGSQRSLANACRLGPFRLLLLPSNLLTWQAAWPSNYVSDHITFIFKTLQVLSLACERKSQFLPPTFKPWKIFLLQGLPHLLSNFNLPLADHTPATLDFWQLLEQPRPFHSYVSHLFSQNTLISQSFS